MKYLGLVFFFVFSVSCFAQSTVSIKGEVIDSLGKPIEAATVFLSKSKDSLMINYTITDAKGLFDLKVKKQTEGVDVRVSMFGFKEFKKNFQSGISEDAVLSKIALQELSTKLDELFITTEAPPIRIKKDTLEFSASSFKVRPDANLEELLKQLPGIQIDENKGITINGRSVNEILVNGKPFFGEDGKIALENLPAEIIQKVQVTDKKSKQEKFTKQRAKSDNASINITIDEKKNKGFFGKMAAGAGSNDRYESSLFLNYFKNKQKVSVIGSANNINAVGFSMDDIFDNMRSGKSSGGITESRIGGLNYANDFTDKLKGNGNYNYNRSETENRGKSSSTKFLPSGEFVKNRISSSTNDSENHRGGFFVDYVTDKNALFINPSFTKNYQHSSSISEETSLDENGAKLNTSNSNSQSKNNGTNFSNSIQYSRKFAKEGQYLTATFQNNNRTDDGITKFNSNSIFYQTGTEDNRQQIQHNNALSDSYSMNVEFVQPVTDSLAVGFGGEWRNEQQINDLKVFDFDAIAGEYSIVNIKQTNRFTTIQNNVSPFASIRITKKKVFATVKAGVDVMKNTALATYALQDYSLDKNYMNPSVDALLNYSMDKKNYFLVNYNYNVSYQNANQLLDIVDVSNPLNTVTGNPDLKPTGNHQVSLSYRFYDFEKRMGYNFNGRVGFIENNVTTSVVYDADKKSSSTYENINGDYSWNVGGEWYKQHKWDDHTLKYGAGFRFERALSNGFIDGMIYESRSNRITPRVYLNYEYGEFLVIKPSYRYNYYTNDYTNFVVKKANNFTHNFQLQTTTYWPKNIIIGNDFSYTYNSQIASGYQKDFYMWNISASYEFFEKKFRARVKIYDVLNQNTSVKRTVGPTEIVDSEVLVLKRYVMFSLIYKLNQFSGKQGKRSGFKGQGSRL